MKKKKTSVYLPTESIFYPTGGHPENGPVRHICIICRVNVIDSHTLPKYCDDCLVMDEAKQLIDDLLAQKRHGC